MSTYCFCNKKLFEAEIRPHIATCEYYQKRSFFMESLYKIPKEMNENDLRLALNELELVKQQLHRMIDMNMQANSSNGYGSMVNGSSLKSSSPQPTQVPVMMTGQIVECMSCPNKFYAEFDTQHLFYVWGCFHLFCKTCILKYIHKEYVKKGGNLTCQRCSAVIEKQQIRELVGAEKFNSMQNQIIRQTFNLASCVKCKSEFQFQRGNITEAKTIKDANGQLLSTAAQNHYVENRFKCYSCKEEQCKSCHAVPYHVGKTCEDFKANALMKKCRYCGDIMMRPNQSSGISTLSDICPKSECQNLSKSACAKTSPCGHYCRGVARETKCLPCLDETCAGKYPELMGQKGDDYCAICYVQSLDASPCIRSACGHIFHEKCVAKRLEVRWLGPRIQFNYCLCPLCKKWYEFPAQHFLSKKMEQNKLLFEKIKGKCVQRLKFEGCDKDEKLVQPASPYYNKPVDYALAIFAYYCCYKCKEPYFGGRKACENALNQGQGGFNEKQLICSNCCEIPVENCPKHGKDYIQFKCKFCCSIAQWFCWYKQSLIAINC